MVILLSHIQYMENEWLRVCEIWYGTKYQIYALLLQ